MNRTLHWITAHPRLVVFAFAVTSMATIFALPRLRQAADVSQLVSHESEAYKNKRRMEDIFGNSSFALVSVSDAFRPDRLRQAREVVDALKARPEVTDVISVYSQKHLRSDGGIFRVETILNDPPTSEDEIARLNSILNSDPLYRGNLKTLGGDGLNLLVEFTPQVTEESMKAALVAAVPQGDAAWVTSGWPIVNATIKEMMDRDLVLMLPLVGMLITLVLYLTFRAWPPVILTLITVVFANLVALLAMVVMDVSVNVVTNAVPVILTAMATSYGIHFLSHYLGEADEARHLKVRDLVIRAGAGISATIFVTSATTIAGFMANAFSPVKIIREFGWVTSIGDAGAALAALVLLPAALVFLPVPKPHQGRAARWDLNVAPVMNRLTGVLAVRARWVLLIFAIGLGALALQVPLLSSEYRTLGYFHENAQVVAQARRAARAFGGIVDFNVVIDTGKPEGALEAGVLKTVDEFESILKSRSGAEVPVTVSLAGYVKQMSRAFNDHDDFHRVPSNTDEIHQYLEVYSWSGDADKDLKYVTDPERRYLRVFGRFAIKERADGGFSEWSIQHFQKIIEDGMAWLGERLPKESVVSHYGDVPMWTSTLESIVVGQAYSVPLALVIVFFVSWPVLRSPLLAFASLIPVGASIIAVFAVMALVGIQLDIATSLVSAMAIGVGVDNSIFFLLTYRKHRAGQDSAAAALGETLRQTGKPILSATAALSAGYGIFLFSSFKPMVYFGLLNVLAILVVTAATLVILPSLLIVAERGRAGRS